MKKLAFAGLVIAGGVVQLTLLDYIRIFGAKPDLLLAAMVIANLFFGFRWAFAFSLFAGIFKDLFVVSYPGLNTVSFAFWSLIICQIKRHFSLDYILVRVILLWLVALLQNIGTGVWLILCGNHLPAGIFLRIVIFSPLYTAVVLPLLSAFAQATCVLRASADPPKP